MLCVLIEPVMSIIRSFPKLNPPRRIVKIDEGVFIWETFK